MKPYFYLSPESVWMYIENCPEEKHVTGSVCCCMDCIRYSNDLQSAKQSAVPFANPYAVEIVIYEASGEPRSLKWFKRVKLREGSLYPVPEGIRVEVRCAECSKTSPKDLCQRDSYQSISFGTITEYSKHKPLAYIIEEPEQEQSQEQTRQDIAKILAKNIHFSYQVEGYVIHGAIDEIIEYFTRKNQNNRQ